MTTYRRVICRVPGSTSNCGSGFDTLGLALSIHNSITVERADAFPPREGGNDISESVEMARKTIELFFQEAAIEPYPVRVYVEGDVPLARGLGSSVTVRGGILMGLQQLSGLGWPKDKLVEIVTRQEGHPDNASASLLGGFTISRFAETPATWIESQRVELGPELRFVVTAPEFEVLTSASRGLLPKEIPFGQVLISINRVSCLVGALSSGRFESLRGTVEDYIHEPYRLKGIPGASAAIASGVAAGALTGWLSGSGSSVLCVVRPENVATVSAAMVKAFADAGLKSRAFDLAADNDGATIVSAE